MLRPRGQRPRGRRRGSTHVVASVSTGSPRRQGARSLPRKICVVLGVASKPLPNLLGSSEFRNHLNILILLVSPQGFEPWTSGFVAGAYLFALIPVQRTAWVQAPIRQIDLVGWNGDGAQRTFDSGSGVVAHSLASFSITNRPTIRPPGNARIFSWWISHNSARDSTSLSVDRSFRGIAQRPIGSDWFGVSGRRLQPLVSAVQNV